LLLLPCAVLEVLHVAGIALYAGGVVIRIKGVSGLQDFFSNVVKKREGQNLAGYGDYMKKTRRFIPSIS
jgi:protein-S-isoprenylcysteine O-methyltransferase Ste14